MIEVTDRLRKGLKRARYWEDECSDGQEALEQEGKMIGHLRSILHLREERKNDTTYCGYAMAIKRKLSPLVATLGGEEERGGLKSKDAVIRFEHYTNLCQRYISRLFYSAARRDFDKGARGRSSFSNVEVHVLMSDAQSDGWLRVVHSSQWRCDPEVRRRRRRASGTTVLMH